MKIAVFDTGLGGQIVAQELKKLRPSDNFIIVNDRANLPYGNKSETEIVSLTDKAITPLLNTCEIIVIACNTATTIAIEELRNRHPKTMFVGFEPMLKPAATLTKTGKIAILATPATLKSTQYQKLKNQWASNVAVFEPDCSDWATQLENNSFKEKNAQDLVESLVHKGVDVIALACTHYISLKPIVQKIAGGKAQIIDPISAVERRLQEILQR